MTIHTRAIATAVVACGVMTGIVFGHTGGTPAPRGQQPAAQAPPPQGRGGEGAQPAAPPQGRQGGGRAGGYTQFTRPPSPPDVLVRGKALYETNCASCHAADLRGTADGKNPNLLRSGVALRDQKGELIGARVAKHAPPITLIEADTAAIAEYIHSVHATMGGQGSPPGRNPTNVTLNVLVGDPKTGEATFNARLRRVPLGHRQPRRDRLEVRGSAARCRTGGSADRRARWRRRRSRRRWRHRSGGGHHGRRFEAGRHAGARGRFSRRADPARRHPQEHGAHQRRAEGRGQGSEGGARRRDREARARGHAEQRCCTTSRRICGRSSRGRRHEETPRSSQRSSPAPALLLAQHPPPQNPNYVPERADAARSRRSRLARRDDPERHAAARDAAASIRRGS